MNPNKRMTRKPKKTSNSGVPDSDSLLRLRDESEEDDIFIAYKSTPPWEPVEAEGEIVRPTSLRLEILIWRRGLRHPGHRGTPKEAPGVI